jgi:ABC-2 type transport system permease protein
VQAVFALLRKETASFFNSLIAYVVLGVFLVGSGLFFWVLGGNILESGAAEMDALFNYAPWFFLLLIPAITMRSFAEERRTGTLELLFTRPLTARQLIWGKYLATMVLVCLALLPTLVYMVTVYYLGNPVGNLDVGATIGAYVGLLGIAGAFAAVGLLCSIVTDNQIVAFILAAFASFVLYQGFELAAELPALQGINENILWLGLQHHYQSISRGVVDTRDVLYFASVVVLLLGSAELILDRKRA